MIHGLAGFQSGCRCQQCWTAECGRMRRIGKAERSRWREINRMADESWSSYCVDELEERGAPNRTWSADETSLANNRSVPVRRVAAVLGRSIAAVSTVRYRPAPSLPENSKPSG